jgi:hypothetical protein
MLKRYNLPSVKNEGWAIIVIDTEIGFFSTVSDWGNYAYVWRSPGREFRAFLADLDADYLCKKLTHGRRDAKVFDEEATKKALLEALKEANDASEENTGLHWSAYEGEVEKLKAFDMPDEMAYMAWQSETLFSQASEYACYKPNPDAWSFCTKVWPRFAALLKQELEKEADMLKALQEARPDIRAAAQAEIAALTKEKG